MCGVCPSVTLEYCVVLIIKQLALDCSLGTLVYGHQTWNIYRKSVIGALNRRVVLKSCYVTPGLAHMFTYTADSLLALGHSRPATQVVRKAILAPRRGSCALPESPHSLQNNLATFSHDRASRCMSATAELLVFLSSSVYINCSSLCRHSFIRNNDVACTL